MRRSRHVGPDRGEAIAAGIESSISTVSIAELPFGLLVTRDDDTRAQRKDFTIIEDLVRLRAPS